MSGSDINHMKSKLVSDLQNIVGAGYASTDVNEIHKYHGDALGVYRAFSYAPLLFNNPAVIVSPQTKMQISRIIKFAQINGIPIVPYGKGTGIMGGSLAKNDSIIMNLQHMNKIIEIDKEGLTTRVQPGVILEDIDKILYKYGLLLGHDPWSRPIASVGGAISTNGVGYRAAKNGTMGDQVLGLEVALANGEIISTKGLPVTSAGPSLNQLFIGSEGILGVITEATISAYPIQEKQVIVGMTFPDFESGFAAIIQIRNANLNPSVIDFGQELRSTDDESKWEITLYIMFEGLENSVRTSRLEAIGICRTLSGEMVSDSKSLAFWQKRHSAAQLYAEEVLDNTDVYTRRRNRDYYRMEYLHVALPISKVLEYRKKCNNIFSERDIIVREWSIWGRPEFFSLLIQERHDRGHSTSAHMEETVDIVLRLAQEMGGAMEYCHGVGIKLSHLMRNELGSGYNLVAKLKQTLDPNGIMNPGKLIV